MRLKIGATAVFLAVVLLIAMCLGCDRDAGSDLATSGYLEVTVEPCAHAGRGNPDPCARRGFRWQGTSIGDVDLPVVPHSFEMKLNAANAQSELYGGTRFDLERAIHLVVRGSAVEDSLKCDTYPWMSPDWVMSGTEAEGFSYEIFAEIGVDPWMLFVCHSQILVHEYLIGDGPSSLTVTHFDLALPYDPSDPSAKQFIANDFKTVLDGFVAPAMSKFEGSEWVLWLSPSMTMASETLQVRDYWDVQRREDGEIVAVSPWFTEYEIVGYSPEYGPEHRYLLEPTLDELRQNLKAANEARVARTSGRIGVDEDTPMLITDANHLRDYFEDIGAYDNQYATPKPPPR